MSVTDAGQVLGASTAIGLLPFAAGPWLMLDISMVIKVSIGLVCLSMLLSFIVKRVITVKQNRKIALASLAR